MACASASDAAAPAAGTPAAAARPFVLFAGQLQPQSPLRAAITAAWRRSEPGQVAMLLPEAQLSAPQARAAHDLACRLSEGLRAHPAAGRAGLAQGLLQAFSLSSQEGVALMCLAEALLRIPDRATRDALIRDKLGAGHWQAHRDRSASLFVNAATWGLVLTGRLVATHNETGLRHALGRVLARGGEPLVRKGVDIAMRLMGEQFVAGQSIAQALAHAAPQEARGFRHSYDMLGEAALTEADAQRYLASYAQAIQAIGQAGAGAGIYRAPGISIKLSALHPRYARAQRERVMDELYPRLRQLAALARGHDIGLNIDAEEADRLELSLDLLERLCHEPSLAGWQGIGFVVQAYQKRCPQVIDWLIDLARRSGHRLMVRLVKGAYWDSEIKRAQSDGLEDYPVYTRKAHTDLAYIACARRLLAAPDAVFPQFATHNAHTLAAVHQLAGPHFEEGQYEFQCLHGMGQALYEQVVGPGEGRLDRPCRIYAPVGTHDTLLAYLVRRLLENGANTSFVHRVAERGLRIEELVADPVAQVRATARDEGRAGLPHPRIPLPRALYLDAAGEGRINSQGLDLANEQCLASLAGALVHGAAQAWRAAPRVDGPADVRADGSAEACTDTPAAASPGQPVRNPARHDDIVGHVHPATPQDVAQAVGAACAALGPWRATPPAERAALLARAADALQAQMQPLLGLLVREAGKTLADAVAELREAVDFLRYYGQQVRSEFDNGTHHPLGPVACISPWNFPLAIFTGQVAAALAAGNTVLAKPAEQTPLIAAQAVRILHGAGLPPGVLQLLPGPGESVGAALVADARVQGVLFTGSTQVARQLQRTLAGRLDACGQPVTLIAETGGCNAMIVDSSALAEQVVGDVIVSAFDSAGQRCSALRLLCLQEDIARRTLDMLRGAMAECAVGNPEHLAVDIGPVIDAPARQALCAHIDAMRARGFAVFQAARLHGGTGGDAQRGAGSFVPPTLIEIDRVQALAQEVFGPVLHVLRYPRDELDALLDQINATGWGLTLGVHSRIDETIARVTRRARAGNLYVNRNMVGAVVGVQPFGGQGLSGTGPKAGGPLYLHRLLARRSAGPPPRLAGELPAGDEAAVIGGPRHEALAALAAWSRSLPAQGPGHAQAASLDALCRRFAAESLAGRQCLLPGPTGERNLYRLEGRAAVLCLAATGRDALCQLAAVLAVGACAVWPDQAPQRALHARLPSTVQAAIGFTADWRAGGESEAAAGSGQGADPGPPAFEAALCHGDAGQLRAVAQALALRPGPIVGLQGLAPGDEDIVLERLLVERSISINTAAAGGNASLMSVG